MFRRIATRAIIERVKPFLFAPASLFFPMSNLVFSRPNGPLARLFAGCVALLFALFFARGAQAQDYRLGPQDVLNVTVLRHPELSAERIEIDPGGRIRLPFVGSLIASGKTTSQLTSEIRRGLLPQLNDPTVTVTLLQARPRRVSVSGAVKAPGLFDIGANWRISEAIAASGGLTSPPELLSATFSRQGGVAVPINLAEVLRNSGSNENRSLRAGDSLRIAENTVPVLLAGQVKTPGTYNVPRTGTLRDAIALAGGFGLGAAQRSVTLTRKNGTSVQIDLSPGAPNTLRVQPGDLIVVTQSNDRVSILGAVAKPGEIALEADAPLTLAQAIIQAGGALSQAALNGATLTRKGGQIVPLDLYGLTVLGDETKNLRLSPGDVVTIPEARGVTVFGAVLKPGTYTLQAARAPRVLDAITAAGGATSPSSQLYIRLERAAPLPGATSATSGVATVAAVPKRTIGDLLAANAGAGLTPTSIASRAGAGIKVPNGFDASVLNARVYDGDLVTVEAVAPANVTVSGEVKTPGVVVAQDGVTLADIIARAGGPTTKAGLHNVSIRHQNGTSERVDIADVYTKGLAGPPVRLRDGDFVVVPVSERLIYVMGAVLKPDYYAVPVRDTLNVGQSLSLAGGTLPNAKISQIAVLHSTPQGVQRNIININQKGGEMLQITTIVRPGDVVYVPEGTPTRSTWDKIGSIIGGLSFFR